MTATRSLRRAVALACTAAATGAMAQDQPQNLAAATTLKVGMHNIRAQVALGVNERAPA